MPQLLCYIGGIYTNMATGPIVQGGRPRADDPWFRPNVLWLRSQWPRVLMRGSAVVRLLGLSLRILPWAWLFCLLWTLCVAMEKSLRRADQSSRGFLLILVSLGVISCNNNPILLKRVGYELAQLVVALRYKSEGRGFDSWWCHWNLSLT